MTKDSVVCGVSFKDDSLLRRLGQRGYQNTRRVDPERDLGILATGAGVETIQDRLTSPAAAAIARARGKADVVVARHIWEHAFDPAALLAAVKELMSADGRVVLEVPDGERALSTCDYSTIWEEHPLYFTPATFRHGILLAGLAVEHYECIPYSLENSLLAVARRNPDAAPPELAKATIESERRRGEVYSAGLAGQRERLGGYLAQYRKDHGPIAILGAGHLACTFINLLGLKVHIDCLVQRQSAQARIVHAWLPPADL